MCTAAMRGPASFYLLRMLLGAAESGEQRRRLACGVRRAPAPRMCACSSCRRGCSYPCTPAAHMAPAAAVPPGCFPGMWYVCGLFYPPANITLAYSAIEAAIAIAQIIAAPLAAGLLAADGAGGLAGWQIMFLAQGAATATFAVLLRARLPAGVDDAPWLSETDKAWVHEEQAAARVAALAADREVQLAPLAGGRGGVGGEEADGAWLLQRQAAPSDGTAPLKLGAPAADAGDKEAAAGAGAVPCTPPPLRPWEQVLATARNRRIWHLVAIKVLKVRPLAWLWLQACHALTCCMRSQLLLHGDRLAPQRLTLPALSQPRPRT